MLRSTGREATVERFIGWLTIALGVGAIIPRPGLGLYALLERDGDRAIWSILLINIGALLIGFSFIPSRRWRIVLHIAVSLLWAGLVVKFVSAQLWGAALQGIVVICFASASGLRLFRLVDSDPSSHYGAKKSSKKTLPKSKPRRV